MRRLALVVAAVAATAFVSVTFSAAHGQDAPAKLGLASLAWLEGGWEGKTGEGTWETSYTSPLGGSMLSSTKLTRDGKELSFDFERWREESGVVVLTPFPGGRASLDFRTTEHAKDKIVLANPENDFPSRFTYAASGKDKLTITLEGSQGGKPTTMVLALTRRKAP
jgi:hypothetical protein